MAYQVIDRVRVWGTPDEGAVQQAKRCAETGNVVQSLLMADHHKGYSQPIGGVVVYDGQISPSGVGYDIACGNKAVRTLLHVDEIRPILPAIMDEIARTISFGIGRNNNERVDHELFDDPDWAVYRTIGKHVHDKLKQLAQAQLGTVGSGNHFVDLFEEVGTGRVWVANHFGSRGFGHKTASGFINLVSGRSFLDNAPGESMDQPPVLLDLDSELGDMYYRAMKLAGRYAYAGRDYVIGQVLKMLGTEADMEVHNHHNFAWKEAHGGRDVIVVRKGRHSLRPRADQLHRRQHGGHFRDCQGQGYGGKPGCLLQHRARSGEDHEPDPGGRQDELENPHPYRRSNQRGANAGSCTQVRG